jgi:uncharacterized membrane protein HdeD (DUF308 family)
MISNENKFHALKEKSSWFILVGIILIVLGCLALGYQFIATVFSIYFIGALILFAGIAQALHSFSIKSFGQSALWAVMGILYIFIGLMSFFQPIAVSSALTLVMSFLLIMSGFTQIFAAINNRNLPRWGWVLTSGIITLILGFMIIASWPYDSLWILGMFLGIDLIFQGWAYVAIGFALKTVNFK